LLKVGLGFEGKLVRMFDGFNAQIYIKVRPIVMTWGRFFDMKDLANRSFLKPGEVLV